MSLQAILDAICASGEDRVRQIESSTRAEVDRILAEAGVDGGRLREEARAAAFAPAAAERARILHRARLEAFRIITAARDELVEKALKQTKENLAGLRKDHLYPALLRRLTKEALLELDGALSQTSLTWLEADPRDEKLLDRILRDWQLETPTSYGLDCWGGVRSRSADGRVVVINTLEARFERATVYLHRYLATLFEGKGSAMGIAEDEGLAAECLASTTAMPGSEQ